MTPQTVNAYNGGLENKIVFPAGILQPPFFDPNGGSGGELRRHRRDHRPRDQPRLRRPGPQDRRDRRGARLVDEGRRRAFDAAGEEVRRAVRRLRAGARHAHQRPADDGREHRRPRRRAGRARRLPRVAQGQARAGASTASPATSASSWRFAQAWRGKQRDEALRNQMASDPHSPQHFRIIGPLRNVDAWYTAFGISRRASTILKPEERTRIW